MQDDRSQNEDPKGIKIKHYIPDGMVGVYADNSQVMHTANEFILSFFQIEHPVVEPDLASLREVRSRCVARIVLSPDQMTKLVGILAENLAAYQKAASGGMDTHD